MTLSASTGAPPLPPADAIAASLRAAGFCFVAARELRALLPDAAAVAADWLRFQASWNGMPRDPYMGDGGRYRYRRYATLRAEAGAVTATLEPHQPHYQSVAYNRLNGGVPRHFEPIPEVVLGGATLQGVLAYACGLFGALLPGAAWHIEVHQFRIEARAGTIGKPTPEGIHRDGVNYVLVMMVNRVNIASGTTTIHAPDGTLLDRFTLVDGFDAALLDDARCLHGVTPVEQMDPHSPAFRDVLVVTFTDQARRHAR